MTSYLVPKSGWGFKKKSKKKNPLDFFLIRKIQTHEIWIFLYTKKCGFFLLLDFFLQKWIFFILDFFGFSGFFYAQTNEFSSQKKKKIQKKPKSWIFFYSNFRWKKKPENFFFGSVEIIECKFLFSFFALYSSNFNFLFILQIFLNIYFRKAKLFKINC